MQPNRTIPGVEYDPCCVFVPFPPRHTFRCFFGFSVLESKPPRDTISCEMPTLTACDTVCDSGLMTNCCNLCAWGVNGHPGT